MLSEVSLSEKDKYHKMLLICIIKKKDNINELIHKTDPQTQKTNLLLPVGKWRGIN